MHYVMESGGWVSLKQRSKCERRTSQRPRTMTVSTEKELIDLLKNAVLVIEDISKHVLQDYGGLNEVMTKSKQVIEKYDSLYGNDVEQSPQVTGTTAENCEAEEGAYVDLFAIPTNILRDVLRIRSLAQVRTMTVEEVGDAYISWHDITYQPEVDSIRQRLNNIKSPRTKLSQIVQVEERIASTTSNDMHRQLASEIFGVDEKDVTPKQRQAAKALNYRKLYVKDPS